MIPLLRAECRKLLTVRSTYIVSAIALVLVCFLSFYIDGFRGIMPFPDWFTTLTNNVSTVISIFVAVIAILLIGHEYRHNTIMYTLTSSNSRTKVLVAKVITVAWFALVVTIIAWALAVFAFWLGASLSPNELQMWTTPEITWQGIWRGLFFVVGFALFALLLGFVVRNLAGAIAVLFIWPMVEGLLTPLLKGNTKYLPFSLLEQVHTGVVWKPLTAAFLFTAYLAVGWLLVWYLFTRRDAN